MAGCYCLEFMKIISIKDDLPLTAKDVVIIYEKKESVIKDKRTALSSSSVIDNERRKEDNFFERIEEPMSWDYILVPLFPRL